MANLAIVENDIIVNIIVGNASRFPAYDDVTGLGYGVGWVKNGNVFDPPTPVAAYETMLYPDELIEMLTNAEYALVPERLKTEILAAAGRKIDVTKVRVKSGLSSFLSSARVDELILGKPM